MRPLFEPELSRQTSDCGIVAVLILDRVQDAVSVARSLVAGGVTTMELTLRTPVALEALKAVRAEEPGMIAGVGTILTPDQLKLAKESGAQFGVSPGVNPRVLAAPYLHLGIKFVPLGGLNPANMATYLAKSQYCCDRRLMASAEGPNQSRWLERNHPTRQTGYRNY
jgi:2-keto-3-deoxy-6-phosphogluconate aldolase